MTESQIQIYNMGRVGSTSVYTALNNAGIEVIQFNNLFIDGELTPNRGHHYKRVVKSGKDYQIVTLVRDPLWRNISAFLKWNNQMGDTPDEMRHTFLRDQNHIWPLIWFDVELKQLTGIDLHYNTHLQNILKERKFQIATGFRRGSRYSVLFLNTKYLSSISQQAFQIWLGKPITIQHLNSSRVKSAETDKLYKIFNEEVRFPVSFLEAMYHTPYATSFMTEEEIESAISYWRER